MPTSDIRRILIWPSTTELANELVDGLSPLRFYELVGAASDNRPLVRREFSKHFFAPSLREPNAIDAISKIVEDEDIDIIYPTHDDAILFIAENAAKFEDRLVVSPPAAIAAVLRSKHKTYDLLDGIVDLPQRYFDLEAVDSYPVFAKPDKGSGSVGVELIDSPEALAHRLRNDPEYFISNVVAEFLPGEEYTVDCFSGSDGRLLFVGPRTRQRVRNGISTDTSLCHQDEFLGVADSLSSQLRLRGAWFFQMRRDVNGTLRLLEVAARFGGSSKLNRLRGVNFGHLTIEAYSARAVRILANPMPHRLVRRLGGSEISPRLAPRIAFVDLDDCLISGTAQTVYSPLAEKIFAWRNSGAKVVLLTRHDGNLSELLQLRRLDRLFDDVIHITSRERTKSAAIVRWLEDSAEILPNDGIVLVDDSFGERFEVSNALGISTFDLTMLEAT